MILHTDKGVNARLTYCPRCGGESNDLVLLGNRDKKIICSSCNTMNYGSKGGDKCGGCGQRLNRDVAEPIEDSDKLPGSLCDSCEGGLNEVKAGGIFFRCDCGIEGVVKADCELAIRVRKNMNKPAPEVFGLSIQFCPDCKEAIDETVS